MTNADNIKDDRYGKMHKEEKNENLEEKIYYLERDLERAHIEIRDLSYTNYKLKRQNIILTILLFIISLIILVFLLFIIFR